ncbi:hotdog domain-containing protein [Streptomyces sp. DSM 44917]|uniref:Hotdog domain-containing protein n=1 Tax=Streptomyces boetiae TaxID=3075541 RepID=A0ABU2L4C6_9ACTN|nr:thioesterase family protein [Streptomyces sp. DSM 44917]MDT0306415.1 hotdog domain-containing protein [Streptomyces sp. DSM 44917]
MDSYGHINNVLFVRYLEDARIDFMFRLAREAAGPEAFTGGVVVARHEIDYLRPLVFRPEPVVVDLWVTRIAAAAATVRYEIREPEAADPAPAPVVYARAATVVVPYDLARERPRRLSAAEKTFLEKYLDDQAGGPEAAVR